MSDRRVGLATAVSAMAGIGALAVVQMRSGQPTDPSLMQVWALAGAVYAAGVWVTSYLLGASRRAGLAASLAAAGTAAAPWLSGAVGAAWGGRDWLVPAALFMGASAAATLALLAGAPGARPPLVDRAAHALRAAWSYGLALALLSVLLRVVPDLRWAPFRRSLGDDKLYWTIVGGLVMGLPLARGLHVALAPPPRIASATERARRALAPLWARVLLALGVGEMLRRPADAALLSGARGHWYPSYGPPAAVDVPLPAALLGVALAVSIAAAAVAELDRPRPRVRVAARVAGACFLATVAALGADWVFSSRYGAGDWISRADGFMFLFLVACLAPAAGAVTRILAEEHAGARPGPRALAVAGASATILTWGAAALVIVVAIMLGDAPAPGYFVRLAPAALVLGWAFAESSLRSQAAGGEGGKGAA